MGELTRQQRHGALRAVAAGQDGQFATAQALAKGLSYRAVQRLRDAGHTEQLRRSVWRYTSAVGDPDPAITAYLAAWPVAVISWDSAAQHHGFRRIAPPSAPHITVPHGTTCCLDGVVVHHARVLEPRDILTAGTVRYTTAARTVVDLSDCDRPWDTVSLVDDAGAAGVNVSWLHETATRLVRGRTGAALVARATSPDAAGIFRSWLERTAGHIYDVAHLPRPEWNVRIHDEKGLIGLADALWRPWWVIAEKEGLRFHTTPAQRRQDAKRFNRFGDAGYTTRRFTWEDVVHTPVDVAATVMRALRAAGADLDPATIPSRIVLPERPFL